jgi:hypothetical protein
MGWGNMIVMNFLLFHEVVMTASNVRERSALSIGLTEEDNPTF